MLLSRSWRWRNHTGLWDTGIAWYSPSATHWTSRGREVDETILDYEIPGSPDTLLVLLIGLAGVVKVTKQYWTMRYRARLILSKCYSWDWPRPWRWRNNTGLWDTGLAWYPPSATHGIGRGCEGDETILDYEIQGSPDTLLVLLIGLAEVVKVTKPYWTMRYRARLILS